MAQSIYDSKDIGIQQLQGPAVEEFGKQAENNRGKDVDHARWVANLARIRAPFNDAHDAL